MLRTALFSLTLAPLISAHTAAWAPGMYCRGGNNPAVDEPNTNLAVNPLYNLAKEDWWFQHHRGCDAAPPPEGEFLEVPANGEFTVELAHNRAFTTLSYDGDLVTAWPDGKEHPEGWNGWNTDGTPAVCLKEDGALHTYNESSTGGTAFAISYNSDIKDVTMENLVVFSTLYHTPWKRIATYKVPDLPACPEDGCTCAWLWIPNGCGEANMYMQGFKCKVTGATSTTPLAKAQVPSYCEDDQSKCVKGAKQMLAWHQATGNNIETKQWVTPNYNQKCGWENGAQTDIFESASPQPSTTSLVSTTSAVAEVTSIVEVGTPAPESTTSSPATAIPTLTFVDGEYQTVPAVNVPTLSFLSGEYQSVPAAPTLDSTTPLPASTVSSVPTLNSTTLSTVIATLTYVSGEYQSVTAAPTVSSAATPSASTTSCTKRRPGRPSRHHRWNRI